MDGRRRKSGNCATGFTALGRQLRPMVRKMTSMKGSKHVWRASAFTRSMFPPVYNGSVCITRPAPCAEIQAVGETPEGSLSAGSDHQRSAGRTLKSLALKSLTNSCQTERDRPRRISHNLQFQYDERLLSVDCVEKVGFS